MKQSSLRKGNLFASHPAYRLHYPIEGVVVRVHFPQDPTNVSGREIEYDVQPCGQLLRGVGIIKNAPLAVGLHGIDSDQETVLVPAALVIPAGVLNFQSHGDCSDTDGDRVLVQFIQGQASRPIITHVLTHTQRGRTDSQMTPRYAGKLELLTTGPAGGTGYQFGTGQPGSSAVALEPVVGDRQMHQSMNGTHLALDRNGDVFIDFKPHPDDSKGLTAGHVAKKLVIQNEGQDLLRLEKTADGSVKLTIGNAAVHSNIKVIVADDTASVALAEPLMTLYNTLKTKLDTFDGHTHSFSGALAGTSAAVGSPLAGTASGTTNGPSGPVAAPTWDSAIVSSKVKVPSNA